MEFYSILAHKHQLKVINKGNGMLLHMYDLFWNNYKAFVPSNLSILNSVNTYTETRMDVMEFIPS